MRKYGFGALALCLIFATVLVYMRTASPKSRPASAETVELSPARTARGEYLVRHVLACLGCHSKRDFNRYGAPIVGHPGAGGRCMNEKWGMPGRVCAPNLTPDKATGLGTWTDGEVMRAIREGVDRHGDALFPLMPYTAYRVMSDDDVRAVVAYLRTLKRRSAEVEPSHIDFPVSFFISRVPQPLDGPVSAPKRAENKRYGEYLATIAGCKGCHTPTDDKKRPLPGMEFAGGFAFESPFGTIRSPNITPHRTGLGSLSKEAFVKRFRAFQGEKARRAVSPSQNTPMPWLEYAGMDTLDLGAIYEYLRSVPPIDHAVEVRSAHAVGSGL